MMYNMTNFHKMLDSTFDEFIKNLKRKETISVNDIIRLKSLIYTIYETEHEEENEYIRRQLHMIELKV